MAYRKIHDDFWTDPDIEELTPEQKFFYIYLITNPNVNQIGLYEFSMRRACFETGYNSDTIGKLLDFFESMGKIKRSDKTKEILVIKFYHHNKSNSPKLKTHVNTLLTEVKDTTLIQYIYGMYTASQEEEEKEEEKEQQEEEDKIQHRPQNLDEVISFFKDQQQDDKMAKDFFYHYDSQSWVKSNGIASGSWQSLAMKWIHQEIHNKPDWKKRKEENTYDNLPFP
jgi:hypothetical protein